MYLILAAKDKEKNKEKKFKEFVRVKPKKKKKKKKKTKPGNFSCWVHLGFPYHGWAKCLLFAESWPLSLCGGEEGQQAFTGAGGLSPGMGGVLLS